MFHQLPAVARVPPIVLAIAAFLLGLEDAGRGEFAMEFGQGIVASPLCAQVRDKANSLRIGHDGLKQLRVAALKRSEIDLNASPFPGPGRG